MSHETRLDIVYSKLLLNHPEGWALYKKTSAAEIKPGSCGYFDDDGDWQGIVQLTDKAALSSSGWNLLEQDVQVSIDTGTVRWGPKHSELVSGYDVGGTVGAS